MLFPFKFTILPLICEDIKQSLTFKIPFFGCLSERYNKQTTIITSHSDGVNE